MSPERKAAVVHLVWGPLGPGALRTFLASYRAYDAGAPHDLVVVFNGVPEAGAPEGHGGRAAFLSELDGVRHRLIELERPMLDLVAYRQVCGMLDHGRVCVLNSHSRLRAEGWLAGLEGALGAPGVGLVGASGSWASMRSYALYYLRLPSAYRSLWPNRAAALGEFRGLDEERRGRPTPHGPLSGLYTLKALLDMTIGFSAFPAHHIRTNAFIAERALLRRILDGRVRTKIETHRLESGRDGLTRRVERAGLRALVVDRHGRRFEVDEWPLSETFWQGDQRGLLVADNQTDAYEGAALDRRRVLAAYAWGERAAASPPADAVVSPAG